MVYVAGKPITGSPPDPTWNCLYRNRSQTSVHVGIDSRTLATNLGHCVHLLGDYSLAIQSHGVGIMCIHAPTFASGG